jgi:dTDP-4-amino-4,6-dideoxygalactose transaminase
MHIRINIPAWGIQEYISSLFALFPLRRNYYLNQLKKEILTFVGNRRVYLLSSGRFGAYAAIKQLGLLHPRIAIPAYVCPSVIEAVRLAGAEPFFIDVEESSICFNREILVKTIRQGQVDAILAPNTYGLDQDFRFLMDLGLPVIEDAAYQAGYKMQDSDTACGLRCSTGIWSFNFKALTSVGGGVLFSREPIRELENLPRPYLNQSQMSRYINYLVRSILRTAIPKKMPGAIPPTFYDFQEIRPSHLHFSRSGMSNLQAAIALTQWKKRESIFERQIRHGKMLQKAVDENSVLSMLNEQKKGALVHLFPILLNIRASHCSDAVLKFRQILYQQSIQTENPYPIGHVRPDTHPNVYNLVSRLILLPCNASLKVEHMRKIARALAAASEKISKQYKQQSAGII